MPWTSTFRAGVDLPTWDWLSQFPGGNSNPGTDMVYDGSRYIYALIQSGSTTAASTTQLWRYDTWVDGWQFLVTTTSGYTGACIEYDRVRNLIYIVPGNLQSAMQVFNPTLASISALGQTFSSMTLTTTTLTLPATASSGAAITMSQDVTYSDPALTGTATGGSNTTVVAPAGFFHPGHVGMQIRLTSGGASGQRAIITSLSADNLTATVGGTFTAPVTNGTTFTLEYPSGTAGSGSTTTLTWSVTMTANAYTGMDVVITGGTGSGQRRRIASNTTTTLTLASATTGNARTGAFTTAPDSTSTFKIVPSSDFLYYTPGNNATTLYRVDLNTGATATTWSASLATIPGTYSSGGNMHYMRSIAPFFLLIIRGNSSNALYLYNIGLATFTTLVTTGMETFSTGASSALDEDAREVIIYKDSATRGLAYNFSLLTFEPMPAMPFSAPSAFDGHRAVYLKTSQGVRWFYIMRAGGGEFYRIPIEW